MTQTEDTPKDATKSRGLASGILIGTRTIGSLCVSGIIFFVLVLVVSERTLPLPKVLISRFEAQLSDAMGAGQLSLGSVGFGIRRDGTPNFVINDLRLRDEQGGAAGQLNKIDLQLSLEDLIRGRTAASSLSLEGAQITFRRTASGDFALASGGTNDQEVNFQEVIRRIDQALDSRAFASLDEVSAQGVVLTLEDARSGRIWQATNASLRIRRSEEALSLTVASDVFNGTDDLAQMQVSATLDHESSDLSFGIQVEEMPAADIALQAPALSWLQVLNAPISGAVRAEVDEVGTLVSLAGTLDISEGVLQPSPDTPPVLFSSAQTYFEFDPSRQRIDFSNILIEAQEGRLVAAGHTYLTEFTGSWPGAFVSQLAASEFALDRSDLFPGIIRSDDIRTDFRLRLDPFSVEFAQVVVETEGPQVTGSGRVFVGDDGGWRVAVDMQSDELLPTEVLQYWPLPVSKVTRAWIGENVLEGRLHRPAMALRHKSGQKEPDIALSFDFTEGDVRLLSQLPPLDQASGRVGLYDNRFTLLLQEGGAQNELGRINAAGSVFTVTDVKVKPAPAEVDLNVSGPLPAALHLMDNPPLRVMERANRPVDIASANAIATAWLALPLKQKISGEDVDYEVSARLMDVSSDKIVPGRDFRSDAITLEIDPTLVRIHGPARLDGVALKADWQQKIGEGAEEGSRVTGTIALDKGTVQAFNLPLPADQVSGRGEAAYEITTLPDQPPEVSLTSNLAGLRVAIPSIGWLKPANETGVLSLNATLGDTPEVTQLALQSVGLSLDGNLSLTGEGALSAAEFETLHVGDWLDAQVRLTPQKITLSGGTVDLRQLDLNGGSSGQRGTPIDLNLDRVVVSDGIALGPLVGQLEQGRAGLSGDFEARVNGGARLKGSLAPVRSGTAIRIQSGDASGVLRDAGITPNGNGGSLDLILTPVAGAPSGTYDGEFLIERFRLRNAPVMADLLDAISVIGLIDQLEGPGIKFETIDGRFRVNKDRLRLQRAAAVGGSIGISADGLYDLSRKQMDFRGVISPVYFLNSIGSIFTRRGEGLFGFNYRMAGSAKDPKVSVNPLSILTPGGFRDIFRSEPPLN